jgi:hypothetical protein
MGNNPVNSIDPTGCENIGGSRMPRDGYQRMAAFHQAYQDWLNNGGKGQYGWSYGNGQTEQDPVNGSGGNGKVQFYVSDGKIVGVDSGEGWMSAGFKAVNNFIPQDGVGASLIKNGGEWGTLALAWEWTYDPILTPNPFKTSISYGKFKPYKPSSTEGKRYFEETWRLPDYKKGNDTRYPGINIYKDAQRGYTIPWEGIHVPNNASEAYIQHEYGHYLIYQLYGPEYYIHVIAKSGWSAIFNNNYEHMRISVELEATTIAHDFFGRHSLLNNNSWPTYYNLQIKK